MFWGFLLAAGFSAMLVKLGALSVWVSLLKMALLLSLVVLACMGIGIAWRLRNRKTLG